MESLFLRQLSHIFVISAQYFFFSADILHTQQICDPPISADIFIGRDLLHVPATTDCIWNTHTSPAAV